MNFYDRESELTLLSEIKNLSLEGSQMTVMTGRRRIGKTAVLLKSCDQQTTLYFFVTRKTEALLCRDFAEEVASKLNLPMMDFSSFGKLFEFLLVIAEEKPFNLIIDEFQEFDKVNPAIFGEIQKYWDLHKDKSKMNLLISGSIYSLMHKIFEDKKEPLFSRASRIIHLKSFSISVLKQILRDYYPNYTAEDLLALYSLTGGVAWYVEIFVKYKALTFSKMIDLVFSDESPFLNEGKNLLIEEFGKDYITYFSILECVSRGLTSRGEIESYLGGKEIAGFLSRLEGHFAILKQKRPIFARPSGKQIKYVIDDNFLSFWFRFIYKYQNYIQSGSVNLLKEIVKRDFPVFSGLMLERYFKAVYIERGIYTDIGGFWDRKGETEIDLIAVNELERTVEIAEIKRNASRIDFGLLEAKGQRFLQLNPILDGYSVTYKGLSMEDM
ncbi:MAG: ATP-binding protein [Bacteroidales bacterium]|nr:ATP-binding protein [Bacteroidales bacterium]